MHDWLGDGQAILAVREHHDCCFVFELRGDKALECAVVAPVPQRNTFLCAFDAPAESPEQISREFPRDAVRAIGARQIKGDLRRFHFAKRCRLQACAGQHCGEKKGVVTGGGMQAGSGVCFLWLALVRRLCVGIVAGRSASVEIRAPGVTAARHSQRYKDCLGHEVIQWLAGNLLDSALQVHEAFSGIAEALPWRSEEHTSELQSRLHLVCRLLLEKKKNTRTSTNTPDA